MTENTQDINQKIENIQKEIQKIEENKKIKKLENKKKLNWLEKRMFKKNIDKIKAIQEIKEKTLKPKEQEDLKFRMTLAIIELMKIFKIQDQNGNEYNKKTLQQENITELKKILHETTQKLEEIAGE